MSPSRSSPSISWWRSGAWPEASRPRGGDLEAPRVDLGELGTEEDDLGRVVNPEQDDDEGAGGAVDGCHRAAAQVETDERLADREQHRGHGRAGPHVPPR